MNPQEVSLQMPPHLEAVAIRLADEGLPIAAAARALRIDSDTLREFLHEAVVDGRLLRVTRDDWPPGCERADRRPDYPTKIVEDRVSLLCVRVFRVTVKEAMLLAALLRRPEATKEQLLGFMYGAAEDLPELKIIDVFVCKLRKELVKHGLDIQTIWGRGYFISPEHRAAAMKLLEDFDTAQVPVTSQE